MSKVFVNDEPVELLPGMTVRHAVIHTGLLQEVEAGKKVYDAWGNEVGLGGAISEGGRLYIK